MTQPRFDHFVITRYSAVFTDDQPPASPEWLEYRLGFFLEACVASLTRQDPQPTFRWLVFFDDRCTAAFRDEIDTMAEGVFEPVWTHEVFWSGIVAREVAARSAAPFVITTRVDSDDAVAKNFVASIQGEFDEQEFLYVNFARGLQVVRGGAVYMRDYPSNPFLSLIERRDTTDPPLTIFGFGSHSQARTQGALREVKAKPMWIQVVHGSNVMNEVRGRRLAPARYNDLFDMDLGYDRHPKRSRVATDRLRHWVTAAKRTVEQPKYPGNWLQGKLDRARGTHTKPRRAALRRR